jgi:2-polyprenyl-3-methyl-5-hydroxy-6-metoxy-1,4-benzoquinol methylase
MDSQAMTSNLLQVKQAMRATWMAGDFGQIARYMEREAEAFVERLGIIPGMKVLDVACGTGNVAVPAARKGAQVVGIDIAPNSSLLKMTVESPFYRHGNHGANDNFAPLAWGFFRV